MSDSHLTCIPNKTESGEIQHHRGPGVTEEIDWSALSDDEDEEGESGATTPQDEDDGEMKEEDEEGEQHVLDLGLGLGLDMDALEARQSPVPLPAGEVGSPLDAAAARSVRRAELRRRRALYFSSPHLFLRRVGPRRSRESAAGAGAVGVGGGVEEVAAYGGEDRVSAQAEGGVEAGAAGTMRVEAVAPQIVAAAGGHGE